MDKDDELMAAFKSAAAAVAERREEADLPTEDRIMRHLTRWCEAWRQDLEKRPADVQESAAGAQPTCCLPYLRPPKPRPM